MFRNWRVVRNGEVIAHYFTQVEAEANAATAADEVWWFNEWRGKWVEWCSKTGTEADVITRGNFG